LEKSTSGSTWLPDLVDANGPDEALAALWKAWRIESLDDLEVDPTSLRLGFMYLAHLSGRLTLAEILRRAGERADRANYDHPACEAFYLLLNEMDGKGSTRPSAEPLDARAAMLFEPHLARARAASNALRAG